MKLYLVSGDLEMKFKKCVSLLAVFLLQLSLVGCGSSTSSDDSDTSGSDTQLSLNPELFVDGALIDSVTTEDCTLSGGTETTCYRITIAGVPANAEIGPFCPPNINSDASEGGIWFDGNGEVYDISGEFIKNLDTLYGSDWLLYDPATGEVNVTDSQIACEAAARPDVAEEYRNHCVVCSIDYYGGGVTSTFLIPTTPVALTTPQDIGRDDLGLTLNGVVFAPAAPVDAILAANTIAAFDDCGGHVNPFEGYHYHAATGCSETASEADGHASLLGYAIDGYSIFAMRDAAGEEEFDLDECRGHSDDSRGYHYHSASAAENLFIGCYHGEQGAKQ